MKKVLFLLSVLFLTFNVSAQCLEITSIFVNSCGPTEGENEMFTFDVGATNLYVNNISVDWPNNNFLGWCHNAGTAASTAALNATILTSCGWLLEPLNDTIPAGANVIVITSENISLIDNSFEGLADTMYILYQCAGNTAGHFANSPSGTRTLTVNVTGPCLQIETATYDGTIQNSDGATVLYDYAGNPTYVNNGCNAPIVTLSAGWSFTDKICNTHAAVNLNTLLAPNATLGGLWSGSNIVDSVYTPNALGFDTITYQVFGSGACGDTLDSTLVVQVVQEQQGMVNFQSCDSLSYGGTTFTNDSSFVINLPASNPYYCDSSFTVNIDITDAIRDSSYYISCDTFTYNSITYTTSTILYDTLAAGGGGGSGVSCPEIFFSEYGEGSSNNKYVEIFNGTGAPVDLSNYSITLYSNGSSTPTSTLTLSGILAPGDVYVIANAGANATILAAADITSSVVNFNGDDAFALYNGVTLVDLIGNIGCDPGTEWVNGGLTTKDASIIRNAAYTTGVTADPANTPCDFPTLTATNWTNLGNDTWTNIGMHTSDCGGATTNGCDTIVIVNIQINYSDSVVVNDTTCNPANANSTTNTFTNLNGCDSVYTHNTYFYPNTVLLNGIFCVGDTFTPPNTTSQYTASGTYVDTVWSAPSCVDYILISDITFNSPPANPFNWPEDSTICQGDSIVLGPYMFLPPFENLTWDDGSHTTSRTITQSGTYWAVFDHPVVACAPLTDTIQVTVITPNSDTTNLSNCDSVLFNGNWYTSNNVIIDTIPSSLACDSFYHYTLISILPASSCLVNYTCTFDTAIYDSYEYTTNVPGLIPGTVIHLNPKGDASPFIGKAHSGTYFAYFNFQATAGTIFYNRYIDVCPGADFRYSFWIRQFDNNPGSDITINVYDGPNNTYPLINTQVIINSGTVYNQRFSPIMTATSNIVTLEFIDNVGGPVVGNDLCFDDFLVEICQIDTVPYDTITFCSTGNSQNLFDSISFLNTNGTWSGPSALSNGYLGTFNPSINAAGTYAYSLPGSFGCADTVFTITTDLLLDSAITIVDSFCFGTNYLLNGGTIVSSAGTYTDTIGNSLCNTIYTYNLSTYQCLNCNVNLGPDTSLCQGESLTLDAGPNFDEYLWSDNSTNQTLNVNATGTYWVQTTVFDSLNNLVANGDFEQGNSGFTSDYAYSTSGAVVTCPNGNQSWGITGCESTYTVINSPNAAHSNFANCGDHTSGTGNMIVVNGSNTPNTNVWCQAVSVSPNTDYVFSAWAMSVENTNFSNVATLHFLINGVQIGNNFSPSTTACNWQQFNAILNSGSNTNITICIESDVISGNNDYAIDDIFFTPYCVNSDTIDVTVNPYLVVNLGTDISTCNTSVTLDATTTNATYSWQDNSSNATYNVTSTGTYSVDVTVNNCTSSDTINVTLNTASTGQTNTTICAGDSAFIANAWQTIAGVYYDTLIASNTCDSVLATTLLVQQTQTNAASLTACSNELPVQIFGNSVSTAGTYYDTIQSALGCDSLINSITLTINNTDSTTVPMSICQGDSTLINGVYQTESGLFLNDTLTGSNGCDLYEYIQLSVNPLPSVILGNDTSIQEGSNYSINVLNPSAGNTYSWTNNLGETYSGQSIIANNTQSAQYIVVATNGNSCSSEDSILITVIPNQDVILAMPTAFSPNGDGLNDVFRPANFEDFDSYILRIYNRWGELIYEEEGYGAAWNGTYKGYDQNVDVYTYYINATPKNSTEHVVQTGNMTIIR